jgi:hypothetical protein
MTAMTLIAVVRVSERTAPSLVQASLTWPLGATENHTLAHDWSNDTWDWRGGRMPESLGRLLRQDKQLVLHGERLVYTSPEDVGTNTNELGRVMVYEIDYEG